MSRSISYSNINKVKDLRRGDRGEYPHDRFKTSWIGFEYKDFRSDTIVDSFIPSSMINDLARELTGKDLINKGYIVLSDGMNFERVVAIYRHDDMCGLIYLSDK